MKKYLNFKLIILIVIILNAIILPDEFVPFYFILALIYFVLDDIRDEIKKSPKITGRL